MGQIPVKWMAPESLVDRKYSVLSDIWSFGVFCWEAFALGEQPYKELTVDGTVNAVLRGHRMSQPVLCPENVYVFIMIAC